MMFPSVPPPNKPEPEKLPAAPAYPPADLDVFVRDPVLQWRHKVFVDLGMTIQQARRLATTKAADLNQARRMIAAGCDPNIAFDILS